MPASTRVERSGGQGNQGSLSQDQPSKSLASPTVQSTTRSEKGKKKEKEKEKEKQKGSGFLDRLTSSVLSTFSGKKQKGSDVNATTTPNLNEGGKIRKGEKSDATITMLNSHGPGEVGKQRKSKSETTMHNLKVPGSTSKLPGRSGDVSAADQGGSASGSRSMSGPTKPPAPSLSLALENQQDRTIDPTPTLAHYPQNRPTDLCKCTLDGFLKWLELHESGHPEFATQLRWLSITQYFLWDGRIFSLGALNLNEKMKHTITHPNVEWVEVWVEARLSRREREREGEDVGKVEDGFITKDHNRPDWVFGYNSLVKEKYSLQAKVCMVFQAKHYVHLDVAIKQLIVYMMKARVTDGCGMGMIVSGSRYRIFHWVGQKLYMAISSESDHYSWKDLVAYFGYTTALIGWNTGGDGPLQRASRKNAFQIFTHLRKQVDDIIEAQRRGSDDLLLDGGPPNLEMAISIEITDVWSNYPGSAYTPSYIGRGEIEQEREQKRRRRAENRRIRQAPDQDQPQNTGAYRYQDDYPDLPDGLSPSDLATVLEFRDFAEAMRRQELEKKVGRWLAKPAS